MTAKYTLQWDYAAGNYGPWKKGDVINIDEDDAEQINRDSPGVLKAGASGSAPKGSRADELSAMVNDDLRKMLRDMGEDDSGVKDELVARILEAEGKGAKNRQVTEASNRGAMSTEDSGFVKKRK